MADSARGARSVELTQEPEVAMELAVEKLKLLHYERDFLTRRRPAWPPLTRTYFARPAGNGGEQFHYFTSLAAYLLNLAGSSFRAPEQFDDPNAACSNIFAELAQCGFDTPSFAPGKLKHGHGREVVGVLAGLCDLVVASHYARWDGPEYAREAPAEDAAASESLALEDDEDDALNATFGTEDGIGDDAATDEESDDDEIGYAGARGPPTPLALRADTKTAEEIEDARAIESAVDATAWKLELERVAPQLKVASAAAETKDWRAHLEQAKKHRRRVAEAFPEARARLERVAEDAAGALAKIDQRERFVNDQLGPLAAEYKRERERMRETQERHDASAETVAELTNELARVGERLEEVRTTMAEGAENVADTTPLTKLKASVEGLQGEMKVMEVRIGIVSNTLLRMDLERRDARSAA
jgi:estrogen-related receptor beta like 1